MADVLVAIDYALNWEDATLDGKVTTDAGGRTRFGIAENDHPYVTLIGFYTMPVQQALGVALVILTRDYAVPLAIAQIGSQYVANKLLSLGINAGVQRAAEWLQSAVGAIPDGQIGPATLAALSRSNSQTILASLKGKAVEFYQQLAASNPAKYGQYLDGWIRRAEA